MRSAIKIYLRVYVLYPQRVQLHYLSAWIRFLLECCITVLAVPLSSNNIVKQFIADSFYPVQLLGA